jgi:actin, other eukaryote
MDFSTHAVVIDNGSNFIRAGISGEDAPRCCFRTVVGRSRMPSVMIGLESKERYIGVEAMEKRGILNYQSPIQRGVVKDWDEM